METKTYEYRLTPLPYAYDTLEPNLDMATMKVHHHNHAQAFTYKLNCALARCPELQDKTLEDILKNVHEVRRPIQAAIKDNAGGVYNHDLYFSLMQPCAKAAPGGCLAEAIDEEFGSFENFKIKFIDAAANIPGSGYAWLAVGKGGELKIVSTANQDCVLSAGMRPVLVVDMWEHAYYLKYLNKRAAYLDSWWRVVNWEEAEKLYAKAIGGR